MISYNQHTWEKSVEQSEIYLANWYTWHITGNCNCCVLKFLKKDNEINHLLLINSVFMLKFMADN